MEILDLLGKGALVGLYWWCTAAISFYPAALMWGHGVTDGLVWLYSYGAVGLSALLGWEYANANPSWHTDVAWKGVLAVLLVLLLLELIKVLARILKS